MTISEIGFQPLFFSPLVMLEVNNADALNSLLVREAQAMRLASNGVVRSNLKGWHSNDDFFERNEQGCQQLKQEIIQAIRLATLKVSPKFDFKQWGMQAEGWINMLDQGGMNTPHDHPAWVWSGCYYVKVPQYDNERSGSIEFLDGRTNIRTLTVEGAECFASKFIVQPKAGMMILFPSFLRHWVHPNESEETRISVAFNVRFVRQ